jgi:hypothetical protein
MEFALPLASRCRVVDAHLPDCTGASCIQAQDLGPQIEILTKLAAPRFGIDESKTISYR